MGNQEKDGKGRISGTVEALLGQINLSNFKVILGELALRTMEEKVRREAEEIEKLRKLRDSGKVK